MAQINLSCCRRTRIATCLPGCISNAAMRKDFALTNILQGYKMSIQKWEEVSAGGRRGRKEGHSLEIPGMKRSVKHTMSPTELDLLLVPLHSWVQRGPNISDSLTSMELIPPYFSLLCICGCPKTRSKFLSFLQGKISCRIKRSGKAVNSQLFLNCLAQSHIHRPTGTISGCTSERTQEHMLL